MSESSKLITGGSPTVYVDDLDRAIAFYTETLGLALFMRAGDEYAAIDAGRGFFIGLHPVGPETPRPGTPGSIQITFGLGKPIGSVVATLESRGVTFPRGVVDDGPVKLAFFHDPDGNELYLCEYEG